MSVGDDEENGFFGSFILQNTVYITVLFSTHTSLQDVRASE